MTTGSSSKQDFLQVVDNTLYKRYCRHIARIHGVTTKRVKKALKNNTPWAVDAMIRTIRVNR